MIRETILLVEDDPDLRDAVEEVLQGNGFGTRSACTGAEALAILESADPVDLVLLDLKLPDMGGRAVATALLSMRERKGTPALAFSASYPPAPLPEPFVGFVPKPVALEELLRSIRAAMPTARV